MHCIKSDNIDKAMLGWILPVFTLFLLINNKLMLEQLRITQLKIFNLSITAFINIYNDNELNREESNEKITLVILFSILNDSYLFTLNKYIIFTHTHTQKI